MRGWTANPSLPVMESDKDWETGLPSSRLFRYAGVWINKKGDVFLRTSPFLYEKCILGYSVNVPLSYKSREKFYFTWAFLLFFSAKLPFLYLFYRILFTYSYFFLPNHALCTCLFQGKLKPLLFSSYFGPIMLPFFFSFRPFLSYIPH